MRQQPPSRSEDEVAMRVGGTAAGLLAGLVIGIALGTLVLAAGSELAAALVFFMCTATGALAGYLSAAAGLGLAEGVAHFFVGILHGIAERVSSPSELAPWWLRWLFVAGIAVGLLIWVTRRW